MRAISNVTLLPLPTADVLDLKLENKRRSQEVWLVELVTKGTIEGEVSRLDDRSWIKCDPYLIAEWLRAAFEDGSALAITEVSR